MRYKQWLVVLTPPVMLFQTFSVGMILLGCGLEGAGVPPTQREPQWISVSYDDLVDRTVIAHSGQSVGALLSKIAGVGPRADLLADLQPYLEPFSFICNEVVSAANRSEELPFVNVLADYPPGSRQPVWAALFREGHYQLFVGQGEARLFLEGEDPVSLFHSVHSVVRHALLHALNESGLNHLVLEVFAFTNDYSSRTVELDLSPFRAEITHESLVPRLPVLPLAGLDAFFEEGLSLEAVEATEDGDLYLYGRNTGKQTIAGHPLSLADFAALYRSIFHHGENAPYVSLDPHEDNRLAKVNFGGLLQDTHVGDVVLEADKLFKTFSTGLDPNTREPIESQIRRKVLDFLTADERSLSSMAEVIGRIDIRFWFYPDEIRTVTDGRIGVLKTFQFFADAERQDSEEPLGRSERDTIDHLNRNFDRYAAALPTLRELNTVGRMMGIVNWLKELGARSWVDLDALLSVELPAFTTPRFTKKMLVLAAAAEVHERAKTSSGEHKVYALDDLLRGMSATAEDSEYIEAAQRWFDESEQQSSLWPPNVRRLFDGVERRGEKLDQRKKELSAMARRLERESGKVDTTSQRSVDRYNAMVDEYQSSQGRFNEAIDAHNRNVRKTQNIDPKILTIVSIGGGIDLSPRLFPTPVRQPNSPLVRRVLSARSLIEEGSASRPGGLRRSSGRRPDLAPSRGAARPWQSVIAEPSGDVMRKRWTRSDGSVATTETSETVGSIEYRVYTPTYFSESTIGEGDSEHRFRSSMYPAEILLSGRIRKGETLVLQRGQPIVPGSETPLW